MSVEIFEQSFLGTLPMLGYFWVLWVFQVFSFLEVLGSEPNEYEVLCLKYPGMSGHTQYFGLPKISSVPKMLGIPKILGKTQHLGLPDTQ